jgi:TonB-dependent starch-binding outer membrane protein SusC
MKKSNYFFRVTKNPEKLKLLRVMKLTAILFLLTGLSVFAGKTYSQTKKLNLEMPNSTVKEVLQSIEEQSEFYFMYSEKLVDVKREVSIKFKNRKINDVLDGLFAGTDVQYKIRDRFILLTTPEVTGSNLLALEQGMTVTGTVTDPEGNPLPGVNIVEVGTTNGAVTDLDGNYTITVSSEDAVLSFSFIGYLTEQIEVGGQTRIDLTLVEDIQALDEVVVIGYGTSKVGDITGSISRLKFDEIETGNLNNVEKQLSGRFSGVNVVSNGGAPGSGATIRIRGTNSILGNTQPLFVIDGIPQGSNLSSNINPNDIESMQVLKDASATAIYGSRGANGVVIITTKLGQKGKPIVNYNSYIAQNIVDKKIDLLNAEELAQVHQMAIDRGYIKLYEPSEIKGTGTDWQDEMFRKGIAHNHQLSVTGGTENLDYRFSGNYLDEEGIIAGTDFQRFSFRTSIETSINEKLKLGGNVYFAKTQGNQDGGAMRPLFEANPIYPVKNENGEYTLFVDPENRIANPVATAMLENNEANDYNSQLNIYGIYHITRELQAEVRFGSNASQNKYNHFAPLQTAEGFNSNINSSVNNQFGYYWVSNNTLTYRKISEQGNAFNAMVGFVAEKSRSERANASGSDYVTQIQEYHSMQSSLIQSVSSALDESQLASFLGRINYNFQEKYLLTVNARYDGSSKFGKRNKWAFFPSGALGWKIHNENFMQSVGFISNLKLRGSYGLTGEQGISSYQTWPTMNNTAALFAGNNVVTGFYPSGLGNPNLKWEVTRQTNLGIDAGFWEGRLSVIFDVYYKKTTDLLYRVALPTTTGYSSKFDNIGSMENKGIELSINSQNTIGREVNWNTNFNFSLNRNKILELGTRADGSSIERIPSPAGSVGRPEGGNTVSPSGLIAGEAIGGVYGWIYDGTYKTPEEISSSPEPDKVPGDAKYRDINGDGMIDGDDRQIISQAYPAFLGGITNNLSYRGFDLSIFLQFKVGHELFSSNHFRWSNLRGIKSTRPWALDAWSENNPDSDIPRADWDYRTNGISTFHVFDASFLRAQNITLGYNLPVQMGWNIQSFRLYFSVNNAFTITNYPEYDPDASATGGSAITSGIDDTIYPLSKSFSLGIDVKF